MSAKKWTAAQIPELNGRTFVVTGANSGLGLVTARQIAAHGGHVVLAVRNDIKGQQAAAALRRDQPAGTLEVRRLDLADLDSVRDFAAGVHSDGLVIDVLINNAGVSSPPRTLSQQGHELQFAVNHLGHFALTGLLLDILAQGQDPRVVTVSSGQHRGARIDFDDLTGARTYAPLRFYRQSKFANVAFALELDRRLRAAGSPVASVLAAPGYVATNLQTNGPTGIYRLAGIISRPLAQSAEQGALPQLYAATAPAVSGGQFYAPDGFSELRGYPTLTHPDPGAEAAETAQRLWRLSEELTGVRYPTVSA